MPVTNLNLNDLIGAGFFDEVTDSIAALEAQAAVAPLGQVAKHSLTTAFNTAATHTTLQNEGLTFTRDDVAGRKLKFTLVVNPLCPGGQQGVRYELQRDGVGVRRWDIPSEALSTAFSHGVTLEHTETCAADHAGSVYRVQMAALSANTQVTSHGAALYPRQLILEDCGA